MGGTGERGIPVFTLDVSCQVAVVIGVWIALPEGVACPRGFMLSHHATAAPPAGLVGETMVVCSKVCTKSFNYPKGSWAGLNNCAVCPSCQYTARKENITQLLILPNATIYLHHHIRCDISRVTWAMVHQTDRQMSCCYC